MPRSTADRQFGFKAKGLVRILLGADLQEVIQALEELGIIPPEEEPSLLGRVRELMLSVAGPLFLTLELVDEVLDRLFNAEFVAEPAANEARNASLDLELLLRDIDRTINELSQHFPGEGHPAAADRAVERLTRARPRLVEIIDLLDATASALEGIHGNAATLADRINEAKVSLEEKTQALGRELDKAATPAEGRTTAII